MWMIASVAKSTPLCPAPKKRKKRKKKTVLIISCVLGRPITRKENKGDLKKCTI